MVAEYEDKIKGLNSRISGLEDDLAACRSKRSELEGDLALTKGRMREMEADMKNLKMNAGSIEPAAEFVAAEAPDTAELAAEASDAAELAAEASDAELAAGVSALAGAGKPEANIPSVAKPASKSIYAGIKPDNLQIVEGIGPKMESVLKENGIDTLATLGSKSTDEIQAILNKYGDKYKIIDPKTWSTQASMAGDGNFDGLIDYQKRLNAGKDNATGMTDSKLEKYLIKIGALKAFKQDDLKAIEGIGPATDKLLRENGINTWRDLANSSAESIKAILTAAGPRFALGDPTTWPKQAELAADGKFDELREYQDFLDGGKG